jgi:urease alpha subunit
LRCNRSASGIEKAATNYVARLLLIAIRVASSQMRPREASMAIDLDLVVKGGTVVTASDVFKADVGVKDGRIAALAPSLDGAAIVDAGSLLVMPGGVDSHVACGATRRATSISPRAIRAGSRGWCHSPELT